MMNLIVVNALDYETLQRKIYEAVLEYSDINDSSSINDASAKYIVGMVQEYLDKHFQEKVLGGMIKAGRIHCGRFYWCGSSFFKQST